MKNMIRLTAVTLGAAGLIAGAGGAFASNISGNPTPPPGSASSGSTTYGGDSSRKAAYGGSVDSKGNFTPSSNTGVKTQYNEDCPVISGDPLFLGQTDPRTGAVDCTYYSGLYLHLSL